MILRCVALLLFASLCSQTHAAGADDPFAEADKHAAVFSARLAKDDLDAVFEHLTALASKGFVEPLAKLKKTTETQRRDLVIPAHGKPVGEVELVERFAVGTSFAKYVFVERFERSALVWTIAMYRSPKGWIVHDVAFSDKANDFYQKRK